MTLHAFSYAIGGLSALRQRACGQERPDPRGKQNHRCRSCGRQFVRDPQHRPISDRTKALIERFNNTLWQRCGRLVRKTLSFSKKLANHIDHLVFHPPPQRILTWIGLPRGWF